MSLSDHPPYPSPFFQHFRCQDMDLTGGLLGGSMNRLAKVTGAKSSTQLMCYLVGFIVVVVMLIWHLIR